MFATSLYRHIFSGESSLPCYNPVKCWRFVVPNERGTRPLVHNINDACGRAVLPTQRPCGYCIGCRLEKSRRVAVRCVHEAQMHDQSSFITLTYSPENLPVDNSISTDTMQKFWKKLRKRVGIAGLKYYSAGEYGDEGGRPHYHACLFGFDFSRDKVFHKFSSDFGGAKFPLYTSSLLSDVWGLGHAYIGDVTFESAAYVARYCVKKVYGKDAEAHYDELGIEPERSWSSQGLAKAWFERFFDDVYPSDEIVVRGKLMKPPPYYDNLLLKRDPALLAELKKEREKLKKNNINVDCGYDNGKINSVSALVKEAQLRVGGLDKKRR